MAQQAYIGQQDELNSESPESLWRAGQCFEKNHEPEQALKTYREMLRDYPESARVQKARERIEALAAV